MLLAQRKCVNDSSWTPPSRRKLIFHLLIYFHHAYWRQAFEMYYNKNTGGTGLQTAGLCFHSKWLASHVSRGQRAGGSSWFSSSEGRAMAAEALEAKPGLQPQALCCESWPRFT